MENLNDTNASIGNNKPTEWDNMVSPEADTAKELTPEDYTNFADKYLSKIFDALEAPENADEATQQNLTAQIAVLSGFYNLFNDEDPNRPDQVFQHMTSTYNRMAELASQKNNPQIAATHQRQADAVIQVAQNFEDYIKH